MCRNENQLSGLLRQLFSRTDYNVQPSICSHVWPTIVKSCSKKRSRPQSPSDKIYYLCTLLPEYDRTNEPKAGPFSALFLSFLLHFCDLYPSEV